MKIDVALDEMPEARDPEQRCGVEDVRADDLRDRQRVDHHHHEPEERAATHRGQADDETERGADQNGEDLVPAPQDERRVIGLHAALDERLRDQTRRAE